MSPVLLLADIYLPISHCFTGLYTPHLPLPILWHDLRRTYHVPAAGGWFDTRLFTAVNLCDHRTSTRLHTQLGGRLCRPVWSFHGGQLIEKLHCIFLRTDFGENPFPIPLEHSTIFQKRLRYTFAVRVSLIRKSC